MTFRPINDEHAVGLCVFAIGFNRSFAASTINAVGEIDHSWTAKLPATTVMNVTEFDDAILPVAPAKSKQGRAYAILRPDGTTVWQLRIFNNQIEVLCSRYTRWKPTLVQVTEFLKLIFPAVLSGQEKDLRVFNFGLRVVDQFFGPVRYSLEDLIVRGCHLPSVVFDAGSRWQNQTDWSESFDTHTLVESLTTTSQLVKLSKPGEKPTESTTVILDHNLDWRHNDISNLPVFDLEITELFTRVMQSLHERNKKLLQGLLSDEIQNRIALNGTT